MDGDAHSILQAGFAGKAVDFVDLAGAAAHRQARREYLD
jgi:hypothetical protein